MAGRRRSRWTGLVCWLLSPLLAYAHGSGQRPAGAEPSYGELIGRAFIASVTTQGEAYAHSLVEQYGRVGFAARAACGRASPANQPSRTFTLGAVVRPDGSLGDVRFAPENALNRCFASKLRALKWPSPGPNEMPVAMRFNAVTGELLGVIGVNPPQAVFNPPPPPGAPYAVYGPSPLPPAALAGDCRSLVEMTVGSDGVVRQAEVVDSCGQPGADAAALDAARQWVISKTSTGAGEPAQERVRVPFAFHVKARVH